MTLKWIYFYHIIQHRRNTFTGFIHTDVVMVRGTETGYVIPTINGPASRFTHPTFLCGSKRT